METYLFLAHFGRVALLLEKGLWAGRGDTLSPTSFCLENTILSSVSSGLSCHRTENPQWWGSNVQNWNELKMDLKYYNKHMGACLQSIETYCSGQSSCSNKGHSHEYRGCFIWSSRRTRQPNSVHPSSKLLFKHSKVWWQYCIAPCALSDVTRPVPSVLGPVTTFLVPVIAGVSHMKYACHRLSDGKRYVMPVPT